MSSWKPTRANVNNNWNLPQTQIEMKSWTCFGQIKILKFKLCHMHNASSHFPSMFNNIGPSVLAMEHSRKPNLWTFDFEWQALQWTSLVEQMMTSTSHDKFHTIFGMEV